jgi:hypothetical protein
VVLRGLAMEIIVNKGYINSSKLGQYLKILIENLDPNQRIKYDREEVKKILVDIKESIQQ